MGPTDIEHDGIPRVCFQWAGEDGNHRCLVRKPKPCGPSRNQCRGGRDKPKPSTSRSSHYQHFMLM